MHTRRTVLTLICMCSGAALVACGGGDLPELDRSDAIPFGNVLFFEDFEDYQVGDFPGGDWVNRGGSYDAIEVDIPANHKFLLEGPEYFSPWGGAGHGFTKEGIHPTYIRYQIHPYPAQPGPDPWSYIREQNGYFQLAGFAPGESYEQIGVDIHFFAQDEERGGFVANGINFPSNAANLFQINRSFRIELKNIDWETSEYPTFDLWINGVEMKKCISFDRPIPSISLLRLQNRGEGRVHFDNILMAEGEIESDCIQLGEPALPLPPPPDEPEPLNPPRFILEVGAFCRSGPGTNYPKVTTFPESTSLSITGQNQDGSWWYSGEQGCWISDKVGQLIGPFYEFEIVIPPPPPEEEKDEDQPGKPSSCKSDIPQDECIAYGGTWEETVGAPGKCNCP